MSPRRSWLEDWEGWMETLNIYPSYTPYHGSTSIPADGTARRSHHQWWDWQLSIVHMHQILWIKGICSHSRFGGAQVLLLHKCEICRSPWHPASDEPDPPTLPRIRFRSTSRSIFSYPYPGPSQSHRRSIQNHIYILLTYLQLRPHLQFVRTKFPI